MDGKILTDNLKYLKNSFLNPGGILLEIGNTEKMSAFLKLEESALPDLAIGQKAILFFNALPYLNFKTFSGTVKKISPSVNTAASKESEEPAIAFSYIDVEIEIDDPFTVYGGKKIYLKKGAGCEGQIIIKKMNVINFMAVKAKAKLSSLRHFSLHF